MIQRRQGFGFALEASESIGVLGKPLGQDFDGDIAIELGVAGAIHLAHSAFTNFFSNGIRPNGLSDYHNVLRLAPPGSSQGRGPKQARPRMTADPPSLIGAVTG